MSDFEINKGVGREVEFKGLRAQYLFIFAFGLLAVFVVFVIMYTAGIGQWTCIGFGVSAATAVVWLTFSLNRRFGSHGLMKLLAARQHPRRIIRSTLTTSTLESKFPVMAVEHGCIVSKDADITVAFRVTLPEVFSVSSAEYEAMHAT